MRRNWLTALVASFVLLWLLIAVIRLFSKVDRENGPASATKASRYSKNKVREARHEQANWKRRTDHSESSPKVLFLPEYRVVAELRDVSGSLRQKELCLDSMNHGAGGCIEMFACHEMGKNQEWILSRERYIKNNHGLCVTARRLPEPTVTLESCQPAVIGQRWHPHKRDNTLRSYTGTGICLDSNNVSLGPVTIRKCEDQSASQKWTFNSTIQ